MIEIDDETKNNYEAIKTDAILLLYKWGVYKELFCEEKGKHALLNSAPIMYFLFHQIFIDDFIITISRLTDLPEQGRGRGKKYNSTLKRLVNSLEKSLPSNDTKMTFLNCELNKLKNCTKEIRKLRNTRKAHRDLNETIKNYLADTQNGTTSISAELPKNIDIEDIENSLKIITNILRKFHCYCFDADLLLDVSATYGRHGVHGLITSLEEGNKCLESPEEMLAYLSSLYGNTV